MTVATTVLISLLLVSFLASGVRGVHDEGLFELGTGLTVSPAGSANIVGDGVAGTGPDWSTPDGIFGLPLDSQGVPTTILPPGGVDAVFIKDDLSQSGDVDRTTYAGAGGSNKNNDVIFDPGEDTWHWDTGNVPAKDDFSNVYAYATSKMVNGQLHLFIYVGIERIDADGDSHIDIELFRSNVGLLEQGTNGSCSPTGIDGHTGCHWSGVRTVGDIIVSMDYVRGGAIGTVSVRQWLGSSYTSPIITLTTEGCNPTTGSIDEDSICAFNNGVDGTNGGVWDNFDRHGNVIPDSTGLEMNAFTEFGIDVTEVLNETPCLTTILGKSRSSQSFTAELKDFAGPAPFNICGRIEGDKFEDLDADGSAHEGGEPLLSGWTIRLYDASNTLVGETVTDLNGHYALEDLFAGTYKVCEVNLDPTIWTQSYPGTALSLPCPANAPNGYTVVIVGGTNATGRDFGNFRMAEVHGVKFIDLNANGVQDPGEGCPTSGPNVAGCSGVTVRLDGTDGMGNAVHRTTTTNSDGEYWFMDIKPGTFTVTVVEPLGFQCSFPSPCNYQLTLQSGQVVTDKDFGDFSFAEVHGVKFIDFNANGVQDPGEGCPATGPNHDGCAGVTIRLDGIDGMGNAVHRTTLTDSSGEYWFMDIKPGMYTVTVAEPSEFFCSFPNPCNYTVTLQSDDIVRGRDFGDFSLAEVHGVKFIDLNGNSRQDPGEGCPVFSSILPDPNTPGCSGVTVRLDGIDGMGSAVHLTTTTDATGQYWFMDLKPGTYTITVIEPSGFFCSTPSPCSYTVTLQSDEIRESLNFGDFSLGEIHGQKFVDANGNGLRDTGEGCPAAPDPLSIGCADVTIVLDGTDGMGRTVHLTTTTDSNGEYWFMGLHPGTYTITVGSEPAGFSCTFPTACSYTIPLESDQVVTGRDFGDSPPREGCTPGFWKNHLGAWGSTGYSPSQTVGSVFSESSLYGLDSFTLLEALSFQGGDDTTGAAQILLRAGTAALLNAAHPSVNYPIPDPATVISMVNSALTSGDRDTMLNLATQLNAFNNLGCTID